MRKKTLDEEGEYCCTSIAIKYKRLIRLTIISLLTLAIILTLIAVMFTSNFQDVEGEMYIKPVIFYTIVAGACTSSLILLAMAIVLAYIYSFHENNENNVERIQ